MNSQEDAWDGNVPRISVRFDSTDSEYIVRKKMYQFDEINAAYFVDDQMDIELDYGNVIISAEITDFVLLAVELLRLTAGRELDDKRLQQFTEEIEERIHAYAKG